MLFLKDSAMFAVKLFKYKHYKIERLIYEIAEYTGESIEGVTGIIS